ncbi:MAG TPA: hypothetical protein PKY81_10515 [bacterium]|nr:hypothetical protein [bacterium]HPN31380.1 hypothetical protein [bacterium]
MIDKTFIEKIEDIVKKNCETRQINDITYSAVELKPVIYEPSVDALKLNSLQSLVDYIKTNRDNLDYNNLTIVVETHNRVKLISNIYGKKRNRDTFIITEINPDKIEFGRYYDMETFMIKLTSLFIENDDRQFLLQHLSKVVIEDNINLADDGISQNISTKKGVSGALKEIQPTKPIICLKPFRTFLENVASERKIEESLEGDPKYEKIIRLIYISGMTNILKNISQQKTTTKLKEDLQLTMEEFYSLLESGLLNINNKY